jgi:hypothetical protein
LNSTIKFYVLLAIIFTVITMVSVIVVSSPPTQSPPKGPLAIGVGPCPEATRNKTELLIDIPDQRIDVRVTFRFNETKKYFIYALLPYTIDQATPYAIHQNVWYPLQLPDSYPEIGNFSRNFLNTSNGSSIVNATLELNPAFQFNFWQPDLKDELTIGVTVTVHESLIAIRDSFGASQTAIFTFFGDVTGMWSDQMSAYMQPLSQMTLGEPFIVQLRLPPSTYYSNSQPSPIEYYMKQDQRWTMFSLDFLEGRYAQTLLCNFVDPVGQSLREIWIFLIGVFSTLSISFGIEAASRYTERAETGQDQNAESEPPPSNQQQHPNIKKLIDLVDAKFEKRLWFVYLKNRPVIGSIISYALVIGIIWYLLTLLSLAISSVQGESLIPSLIGLVAALISFIALINNIPRILLPEERLDFLVNYNFGRMKKEKEVSESERPFLKALIKMKSKNLEFNLNSIANKELFDENRLLERLYE